MRRRVLKFVFDSSTEVGTYDAALTVEEQSYSTVRNPFWANSHIYFCKYCTDTVNLQKLHINKKINVLFYVCPPCALRENINSKRTFGRLPMTINREYVCKSLGTKPVCDRSTSLLPCGNRPSYPVTNQVQRNQVRSLKINPVEVPHAYAYITETKNLKTDKDSKISK